MWHLFSKRWCYLFPARCSSQRYPAATPEAVSGYFGVLPADRCTEKCISLTLVVRRKNYVALVGGTLTYQRFPFVGQSGWMMRVLSSLIQPYINCVQPLPRPRPLNKLRIWSASASQGRGTTCINLTLLAPLHCETSLDMSQVGTFHLDRFSPGIQTISGFVCGQRQFFTLKINRLKLTDAGHKH